MTKPLLLEPLERLVGSWTTEMTHPAMPAIVVYGTVVVDWLEGERFLIHRARTDHAEFPDSISIIGDAEQDRVGNAAPATAPIEPRLSMHYFDSRGVFRVYQVSADDQTWRIWRDAPGFSQRFTGTFSDGGNTIAGLWQLRHDDDRWNDDLKIIYQRRNRA
jgi:hypothetical protein